MGVKLEEEERIMEPTVHDVKLMRTKEFEEVRQDFGVPGGLVG